MADPSRTEPPGGVALEAREVETALGFWLRLAHQQDLRRFNASFADQGVTQLLYAVLLVVAANPGCRQSALCARLRIRQPNMVEPIESLIGRGLLARTPDPRDRRAQTLSLTPEGETTLAGLRASHDAMIQGYRDRLGPKRYNELTNLLRLFVAETRPAA